MISTHTDLYCVIGNPVAHSLSPKMHNAAFRKNGCDAVYLAFQVEDIGAAVTGIRGLGIKGASVTIPHKVSVIPHLDELDETARKIGAVNTIARRKGKLVGFNTDCPGALSALEEKTEVQGKKILIIGAGGAARAIGFGIVTKMGRVSIANRTPEKGKALAGDLFSDFRYLDDIVKENWDVIVNTTSVGMTPETNSMPLPETILRPGQVVMDIVYNPLETLLLKKAAQKGCIIVDGAAMFVRQGACQFELWTGKSAPIETMEDTVRNALK